MFTMKAPAKINLTLEVLAQRPDGFHEIRSVLKAIDLCDTLRFSNSKDISITCAMPEWSAEKSQVYKAVKLLQNKNGVAIKIEKRIPLRSGLGGDSSDAAVTLRVLNDFWELKLSSEKLLSLAGQLGSDVPFFIRGGTALAEGRGEIIEPLPSLKPVWLVLVFPDIPAESGKTGRMYAALKPSHFTDGSITQKFADTLHKGEKLDSAMLFNTFENVAFDMYPGLSVYREHLTKLGAPRVHLAGSGPTLFSIFSDKSGAEALHQRCLEQGMKSYLAATL
jgi:4-diphosphocytidyl-2-C-methyl-D-erythritol kinase